MDRLLDLSRDPKHVFPRVTIVFALTHTNILLHNICIFLYLRVVREYMMYFNESRIFFDMFKYGCSCYCIHEAVCRFV
jgi:hypothetical protein